MWWAGLLIWALTSVTAYYLAEAACLCCGRMGWDRSTKEIALLCSIFLGPVFLVIAAELLLLAAVGRGLASDTKKHYKD